MTEPNGTQVRMCDGEVRLWSEQGAVHIRVTSPCDDPVELTAEEACQLAEALTRLAREAEAD